MAGSKLKTEEVKASSVTSKKTKVKALVSLSGRYFLPYSEGQIFECEEKQAKELVEEKAVEYVK